MAKNWVQPGDVIELAAAPYARLSGEGCLQGSMFGVSQHDASNGSKLRIRITGVVTLAKVSAQAWTVGQRIYWDDSAKLATNVTATANTIIGVATAAATNPTTTGQLRLTGVAIPAITGL